MKHIFYFVFVFLIITIFNLMTVFAGNYYEVKTKEAQEQTDNLTAFLKEITEKMWETGKFTEDEKKAVDIKMQDYYNYLSENGDYIIVGTAVSGGPVGSHTYNGTLLYYSFYSALDDNDLYKAIRVFDINCFLYINGYKYLTSYLSEYFVKENGEYLLDGMIVTKYSDDVIEIDLSNAEDYIIEEPNENRDWGIVKVISPSGNTYITANSPSTGGIKCGYFKPTEKGLAYKMECGGKLRTFILNSNGRSSLTDGECFNLSDIFYNVYLKQSNTDWNFRDILTISKVDDKNYIIKLKNLITEQNISESIQDIYASDGLYDGGAFQHFFVNESKPRVEFYWNNVDTDTKSMEYPYLNNSKIYIDDDDGTTFRIITM